MNTEQNNTRVSGHGLARAFNQPSHTAADTPILPDPSLWGGIINPLAHETLIRDFFNQPDALPYAPLFLGTAYEELLQYSPYCFSVPDYNHPFLSHLAALPPNWGFLWAGEASLESIRLHWQSLLSVLMPSGKLSHFRFYSPTVLVKLAQACTETERMWLLGPCAHVFVPADIGSEPASETPGWFLLSHPLLKEATPAAIAAAYKPMGKPWWQVTEQHKRAFTDTLHAVYLDNIEQRIWMQESILAEEVEVQYGSVRQFISTALEDARNYGFNTPEHEYRFIMLCLHYDCNTSPSMQVKKALSLARHNPDEALSQLEKVLRNPLHERYEFYRA